jgi:hypothetical protein
LSTIGNLEIVAAGVLDLLAITLGNVADAAGVELVGAGAAGEIVLSLVGIGMPVPKGSQRANLTSDAVCRCTETP